MQVNLDDLVDPERPQAIPGKPKTVDMTIITNAGKVLLFFSTTAAAADPGMSSALRSVGLLDVLSRTPAGPSVARLVSTPNYAASLRNLVRNAG